MKTTDTRLAKDDKALLSSLVGCELESFVSDKYTSARPISFGIIGLRVAGSTFVLQAKIVAGNPFGEPDDVTQLSFRRVYSPSISPMAIGAQQVEQQIGRRINNIAVYEDTLDKITEGEVGNRYISTPAIAFELEGTELVFENQGWLDEVIDIHRGPGASREIRAPESLIEDEDPGLFKISRAAISLGEQ